MLYAVASLALALAPTPAKVLAQGVRCDSEFISCSNGVSTLEAKLEHIKTLKASHGVLANGQASCTGSQALAAGAAFNAEVDLYALGKQTVTLAVSDMRGTRGIASLSASGVADFECHGIAFEQSGSKIVLDKALHEDCPALSESISLSKVELCADQKELHAKIGTPFVDLHVAAQGVDVANEHSVTASGLCTSDAQCTLPQVCVKDPDDSDEGGVCMRQTCKAAKDCTVAGESMCVGPEENGGGTCINPQTGCSVVMNTGNKKCICGGGCAVKNPADAGAPSCGDAYCAVSGGSGPSSPSVPSSPKKSSGCFDKDSTTACLLASPTAECDHVLMADLVPGDLVLGRDGPTSVVAVQHKAVDTVAEMLTFHTADGSSVSMTPNHAVFVDGELVAADDAKVGSALSTGIVTKITKGETKIINAATADGTIVADGVLAASNPMWIASLTVDAPLTRAVVNAVLYAVGDVDSVAAGCAKVAATLAAAALTAKSLRMRKASV